MKRFVLDIAMLIVIVVTMGFHFLPQMWHEVLGLILLAGVCWHLGLNHRWFGSMLRGKWNRLRLLQTALGWLLVLCFLITMVTGIIISNYVFKDLWVGVPLHRSIFVHQLHIASAYLMVILGGMHLGMHWLALWQLIRRLPVIGQLDHHPSVRFWVLVLIGWAGVLASRLDHVGDRLVMKHIFGTAASHLPNGVYYLLLLCVFGLYAIGFYYLQKRLQRRAMERMGGRSK